MNQIINLKDEERRILFRNTAQKLKMHEAIVEKDFWVCFMLDYLFHQCKWKKHFIFKGGTSLSKCYHLIHRFSEDIDLILDWRMIGYEKDEPWLVRSNTQQEKFNKMAYKKSEVFLHNELLPILKSDITKLLKRNADFYIDNDDAQTICFSYPRIFSDDSILQMIRLEIGIFAAWTPSNIKTIKPFVAECYPHVFKKSSTDIMTVSVERTFWEKVTILHHEANRPQHLMMPKRYSRHYYDLYCMAHSNMKENLLNDLDMLDKVVSFKMKFYPRKWAKYEDVKLGEIRLVPPAYRLELLKKDYLSMQEMIYGEYPSFEKLIEYIMKLEQEIHQH